MNKIIIDAIQLRRGLTFQYDGGTRKVEPHCYGINKLGHEVLRAYQVDGSSSSGVSSGWKMFRVDQMSGVGMNSEVVQQPRSGFNPNDKDMTHIFVAFGAIVDDHR